MVVAVGDSSREVVITLGVALDPKTAKVFQDTAKAAQKAQDTVSKATAKAADDGAKAVAKAEAAKSKILDANVKVRAKLDKQAAKEQATEIAANIRNEAKLRAKFRTDLARSERDAQRERARGEREAQRNRDQLLREESREIEANIREREKAAKDAERAIARERRTNSIEFRNAQTKVRTENRKLTASFRGVAAGVANVARGVAILGIVGEKDIEKLVRSLLKVQAGIDVFRGSIQTVLALVRGWQAYRAAVTAAAVAQGTLATAQAVTVAGGIAGGVGGKVARGPVKGAIPPVISGLGGLGVGAGGAKVAGGGGLAAAGTAAAPFAAGAAAGFGVGAAGTAIYETGRGIAKSGFGGGTQVGGPSDIIGGLESSLFSGAAGLVGLDPLGFRRQERQAERQRITNIRLSANEQIGTIQAAANRDFRARNITTLGGAQEELAASKAASGVGSAAQRTANDLRTIQAAQQVLRFRKEGLEVTQEQSRVELTAQQKTLTGLQRQLALKKSERDAAINASRSAFQRFGALTGIEQAQAKAAFARVKAGRGSREDEIRVQSLGAALTGGIGGEALEERGRRGAGGLFGADFRIGELNRQVRGAEAAAGRQDELVIRLINDGEAAIEGAAVGDKEFEREILEATNRLAKREADRQIGAVREQAQLAAGEP